MGVFRSPSLSISVSRFPFSIFPFYSLPSFPFPFSLFPFSPTTQIAYLVALLVKRNFLGRNKRERVSRPSRIRLIRPYSRHFNLAVRKTKKIDKFMTLSLLIYLFVRMKNYGHFIYISWQTFFFTCTENFCIEWTLLFGKFSFSLSHLDWILNNGRVRKSLRFIYLFFVCKKKCLRRVGIFDLFPCPPLIGLTTPG